MPIHVALVEDHTIFREALKSYLEKESDIKVVAEAASVEGAIEIAKKNSPVPEVFIMDVSFGKSDLNGIDATKTIATLNKNIRIIALSNHIDLIYIKEMIAAGAFSYYHKECSLKDIIYAIRNAYQGKRTFSKNIDTALLNEYLTELSAVGGNRGITKIKLTDREKQTLKLIARGFTMKNIATKIGISYKTVSGYRKNLLEKLGMETDAELTIYALRTKIITLDN